MLHLIVESKVNYWDVRVHISLSPDHLPFVALNAVHVAILELPLVE